MSQELEMRITAKVDEALAAVRELGDQTAEAMGRVEEANERVAKAQESAVASARNLATGFSGVLTAGFNLYMGLDRIEKAQYAASRASYQLEVAQKALEEAQRKYNEAVAKYGPESEKAQEAAKNLALAQEKYQLAAERAQIMQNNVNQTVTQFALSVVPTVITMIDSGVKAFQSFHAAIDMVNKVTAFLAANPIMAAIMAIGLLVGALITAYQTCEPFRNAVNAIGQALYNFLKPAIDAICGALTWFWDNVLKPLCQLHSLRFGRQHKHVGSAAFKSLLGRLGRVLSLAISGFWNTYMWSALSKRTLDLLVSGFWNRPSLQFHPTYGWMNI